MTRWHRARSPLLALAATLGLTGCAAAKGSYVVLTAQQNVHAAQQNGAEDAVYYWTLATEYMEKAREEWGHSDYGPAEELAHKAEEYAQKAQEAAASGLLRNLDENEDDVPDELKRKAAQPELLEPDRVEDDFEDLDEDP